MRKRIFACLMLCVSGALLLAACGGSETNSNNASATNTTKTTTTTTSSPATSSSPATTASSPAATTPASGDKIGVADCDEFIEKYEACISDKVPAAARAQYESTLAQWRKSWRDLAANPQTKPTLINICKTSIEQARQSMGSFGCKF